MNETSLTHTLSLEEIDSVKVLLAARMEEYKAIRAEIIQNLASQHQLITVSVTAVGAIVAATQFIRKKDVHAESLLLVFAIGSIVLTWLQLRYARSNMAALDYLAQKVAPHVNAIMIKLAVPAELREEILIYERQFQLTGYGSKDRWWDFPLEASRYLITLAASAISFIAYIRISHITGWMTLLTWSAEGLLLAFTLYALLKARSAFLDSNDKEKIRSTGLNPASVDKVEQFSKYL
ncbi:MAG TPA: hypothetical protein VFQ39_00635 [Longimicrobium sp.]|nr:hypothetical protein [Longimicrobium sp.]